MRENYAEVISEIMGGENVLAFAARIGVSSALYTWLRGEKKPRLPGLTALAKVATQGQILRLLVALEILSFDYLTEIEQLRADLARLRMRTASRAGNMPR